MKSHLRSILIGLGFTLGIQILLSLTFTWLAYGVASSGRDFPQGTASVLVFGFTLGAFLIGGIVIGWINEKLRLTDTAIAVAGTLLLNLLIYSQLPSTNRGQFVSGYWLSDPSGNIALTGRGVLFVAGALAAAAVGTYIGWHMTVPGEGIFDRVALLLGLLGAVVGPFLLLAVGGRDPNNPSQPGLPWYFLLIVLVIVLVIIGIGFFMFTRDSAEAAEEISINPDQHKSE